MEIRLGTINDIDSWMRLVYKVKDIFPGLETKEAIEEHRNTVLEFISRGEAICALDEGNIIGILLFSKEMSRLCFLAVDSAYRRQHIAYRLVKTMYDYMDPVKDITLETHPDGVPEGIAARKFYKSLGFVEGCIKEEFGSSVQKFILRGSKRTMLDYPKSYSELTTEKLERDSADLKAKKE